ncbi:DUF4232 domain-containing protein [Streptomyces sp. B21-083]|uniref:DUF4232 domain-containing protein n=1 Tax=Streptomyces sp. B21-083 TaxID=3039410 RepID=UPI002FF13AFC
MLPADFPAEHAHDSARHLLLTATNTGNKKCALYRYPVVRFDEGGVDQVGPMESEKYMYKAVGGN